MSAIAVIHVLCEANPSLGTSVVNGLLAWATVLGGFTVLFSGLPAAACSALDATPADGGSTAAGHRLSHRHAPRPLDALCLRR